MDASLYKTYQTSRGINYSYFFSPARNGQRTILFIHGFPSTSQDWHKQVAFFIGQGYGALVPDQLGYGGTDKPTIEELDKFKHSLIAKDMVELLDREQVGPVVSVGHDWGAAVNSRVAQLFSSRFDGFAYFAAGYIPPNPNVNVDMVNAFTKQTLGYEIFGYWHTHTEPGAAEFIESHWDSYFSLIFPHDPVLWKEYMGPIGGMKKWLEEDRRTPLPSYITSEDKERLSKALLSNGMRSPLLWYNVQTSGVATEDDKTVPESSYSITKPVFYGGAEKDYVCVTAAQISNLEQFCPSRTVHVYGGDHWIIWSHAEQINNDLAEWLKQIEMSEP